MAKREPFHQRRRPAWYWVSSWSDVAIVGLHLGHIHESSESPKRAQCGSDGRGTFCTSRYRKILCTALPKIENRISPKASTRNETIHRHHNSNPLFSSKGRLTVARMDGTTDAVWPGHPSEYRGRVSNGDGKKRGDPGTCDVVGRREHFLFSQILYPYLCMQI